jgi:formylglycine-generating enzyme
VQQTGHVTVAQRQPDPAHYPGARPELLVPGSTVFVQPRHRVDLGNQYNWWSWLPGANSRHPRGPTSTIRGLDSHPVVQVAWDDVQAYASWAGKQLPTEAEWEFAARGGLDRAEYTWGNEFTPAGRYMANTWQGEFPIINEQIDGFEWTAPVGAFPPNDYGLYDMAGNVWEWTTDWFQQRHQLEHACCTISNPRGGDRELSYDLQELELGIRIPRKVIRAARTCARRTTAAGTGPRRACRNQSTRRLRTSDSVASCGPEATATATVARTSRCSPRLVRLAELEGLQWVRFWPAEKPIFGLSNSADRYT